MGPQPCHGGVSTIAIEHSRSGVPIRLTDERWRHIVARHPELDNQRERILETIADPDAIYEGDTSETLAIRFYARTPLTSKHLVVAYREMNAADGFVVTAYLTRRPSAQRVVIWKR